MDEKWAVLMGKPSDARLVVDSVGWLVRWLVGRPGFYLAVRSVAASVALRVVHWADLTVQSNATGWDGM